MEETIAFVSALPGVDVLTAGPENGSPEVAWGDVFFYYDPGRSLPADRRMPFATIVVSDYPGFDEQSQLDRDGVYRVNVNVGRQRLAEIVPDGEPDYAAFDVVLPHPLYAVQGWASIVNPGQATGELLQSLLRDSHARAAARHREH